MFEPYYRIDLEKHIFRKCDEFVGLEDAFIGYARYDTNGTTGAMYDFDKSINLICKRYGVSKYEAEFFIRTKLLHQPKSTEEDGNPCFMQRMKYTTFLKKGYT